ncbi:beta-1,4-glucuronyltransferase 1-like isoform X2 [Eriocheir sinensis]|nr:beta-1,4-glucuronyltransferase 1-like isoform X2 [Eriocheir sinensis]
MASLRVVLVRGSLMLNAVLVFYLCLSWISNTPNVHSPSSRDVHELSTPAALYAKYYNGASVIESVKLVNDGAEPLIESLPLNQPPSVLQGDEGMKDVSLGGRRTLGQLPEQGGVGGGEGGGVEPEEPPREVQESVGVTEQLVEPLPMEPPDPPLDSLERKMYPDLRECTTKPLRPFYQQRGEYWVLENYLPAAMSFRCDESITYTTHGDYTFLDNLEPLTSRWQGPVSVAVYAPGDDFNATVNTILYLRDCWAEGIKKYVNFHLFFHVNHTPKSIPSTEALLKRKTDCGQEPPKWTNVTTYRQAKKLLYPVNVARNTARQAVQTYFVFPSDVELYPSVNLIPEFFRMLKRPDVSNTTNPRVFVFSIFEVQENVTVPETKEELLRMLDTKEAIPFHKYVCPKCHNVPMSKEWMKGPVKPGVNVFHIGKRKPPFSKWEPIYIGTNKDPLYDERLSWEGKSDKMTQMYILCVRDYEFHILDNAFLVHRPGIKKVHKEPQRDKIVARQNAAIRGKILPEYKTIFGIRKSCVI